MFNRISNTNLLPAIHIFIFQFFLQGCVAAAPIVEVQSGVIHFDNGRIRSIAVSDGDRPYVLAALSFEGIASLSGDGQILDVHDSNDPLAEIIAIAVSDEYEHASRKLLLVATADLARFQITLRGLDPQTGRFINSGLMANDHIITIPPRTTHLCFARDRYDDSLYLYAGGDHGQLFQTRIYSGSSGLIHTRELQQIVIGGPTSSCSSDDRNGIIYVTEPDMGLWQVVTDPEEVPFRAPVALNKPYGELGKPVAVTAIIRDKERMSLLLDTGLQSFLRVSADGRIVSRQDFAEAFAGHAINGSIADIKTGRLSLNGQMQEVIAVAITGVAGTGEIYLLPLASSESSGTQLGRIDSQDGVVQPLAVTDPVSGGMDAADDPAIWVNPRNPAESLILGADKRAGLGVYDLRGKLLQFLQDGRIDNVDVHSGFVNYPKLSHIAVASDRTNTALAIYSIDEETLHVSRVDARTIPAEFYDVYGLCLYRSAMTGDLYAFATSGDGFMHQWRLFPLDGNKVDAELVRRIKIGTVAEGCVADDETGFLYAAEERVGIWRYGAEPGDGDSRTEVARIRPAGELTADLEGMAIYKTSNTAGYLVISSQGSDNYSVYDRQPPHVHRGIFRIRVNARAGIDGTSQTDGIDITEVALPGFPKGLMVAQDGRYDESQNFKYISWADIAKQLRLE